jgi:hypothetical protein
MGVLHNAWVPRVGARFSSGELELTLTEVSDVARSGPFESYSLLFSSGQPATIVQGTYQLTDPDGVEHDMFLVPLSPDTFESVLSDAVEDVAS